MTRIISIYAANMDQSDGASPIKILLVYDSKIKDCAIIERILLVNLLKLPNIDAKTVTAVGEAIVLLDGQKYLTTNPNSTTIDNLGELPYILDYLKFKRPPNIQEFNELKRLYKNATKMLQ